MFDLITKCVFVILWIFMVSAYHEEKGCLHPGANYHMKVNMSKEECEGFFPSGTIATYYCDDGYNLISNRSMKYCVDGIWEETEPIFCGIKSSTNNKLFPTNSSIGSLHVKSNRFINNNTKDVFVYKNENCKNSKNENLTSIYIHLKNEYSFSIVVLQLTFELVNKDKFNVGNLQEKINATYHLCATDIYDCILFKSIKKMFKHVFINSKLILLYHFQIRVNQQGNPNAQVAVKIKRPSVKTGYFLCNIALYANLDSAECGSPNQNEGTLMTSDTTKANYLCPKNSHLVGNETISCKFGIWTDKAPTCQDECNVIKRAKINNIIKTTVKTVVIIIIIQWMLTGIAFLYFRYYKYQAKYLIKIKNDN